MLRLSFVACVALAACQPSSKPSDESRRSPDPAPSVAPAPAPPEARPPSLGPDPEALRNVNTWAETRGLDRDLPRWLGHLFAREDEPVDLDVELRFATRESPVQATATVVEDGYLDDSVRGTRHRMTFSRASPTEGWRLESVTIEHRCWPGRGSETFSTALCR